MNTHRGCRHFAKADATCSRTKAVVEPKGKLENDNEYYPEYEVHL